MTRINVYVPMMDGSFVPVKFKSIESTLKSDRVLIFTDEDTRNIYIWTGRESNIRKRFISSQVARQIRLEKGLTHHVSTHEEGNETTKFKEMLKRLEESNTNANEVFDVSPITTSVEGFIDDQLIESMQKPVESKTKVKSKGRSSGKRTPKQRTVATKKVEQKEPVKVLTVETNKKPIGIEIKKETITIDRLSSAIINTEKAIADTSAQKVIASVKSDISIERVFISTASKTGRFVLYFCEEMAETVDCSTKEPNFVIYFTTNLTTVLLDNLGLLVEAGKAVYCSSPGKLFAKIDFTS